MCGVSFGNSPAARPRTAKINMPATVEEWRHEKHHGRVTAPCALKPRPTASKPELTLKAGLRARGRRLCVFWIDAFPCMKHSGLMSIPRPLRVATHLPLRGQLRNRHTGKPMDRTGFTFQLRATCRQSPEASEILAEVPMSFMDACRLPSTQVGAKFPHAPPNSVMTDCQFSNR